MFRTANAIWVNFEGGGADLANPTNFSRDLPGSSDSRRVCKF